MEFNSGFKGLICKFEIELHLPLTVMHWTYTTHFCHPLLQ